MFGSRIVNRVLYDVLTKTPAITSVVGTRIVRGVRYPQGTTLPAVRFYMEQSVYDLNGTAAKAEHLDGESMRFAVSVDDTGTSDDRIAPVAQAQLNALAGAVINTANGEQVTFVAQGEIPLTSYVDGDQFYQRLGTIYSVTVTRGG